MMDRLRRGRPPRGRRDPAHLAPLLLTLLIAGLAVITPKDVAVSRLLPAAPALAASMWSVGATVALGVLGLAVVVAIEVIFGEPATSFAAGAIVAVTMAAAYASHVRLQRERSLTQVRSIADTAQAVVLRPLPPRVGNVDVEALYLAAAAQARIGGDFYEAVDTPYGVRLLIGDVRGKGLSAVGVASAVVSSFREAAFDEPDLVHIARRLDTSMSRYSDTLPVSEEADERFATALLVQIPHGGAHALLLNCGHPSPLLLGRGGDVRVLDQAEPSPPINLARLIGADYRVDTVALTAGDRLLLYTDGVTETRDRAGVFFPLPQWVRGQDDATPRELLDRLHQALLRYSDGRLDDDIAALLVCWDGAAAGLPSGPG